MNVELKPNEAIQDLVRGECFGCGADNSHGLQIKTYWDGETGACTWTPGPHHCGGPGYLYGGIIAGLIDCHACVTAMAAAYEVEGRPVGSKPDIWFMTASLKVDYLKPTPIASTVELTARVREQEGRKSWVECAVFAEGVERAKGEGLFIRVKRDG